ncbi:Oidioi.mRNA.OKI2018_I69.chr2.g5696.t1.cds [Oikopleura dioica]|uniref:Oidioi.mRNA.OKI2018_I69.chr2.g5696.t1.cds n=1 Tax=Oikopleura dioica TaxID=34765 RepID=A0ABN7T0M6_OIKDI|nr:Oidioi.mRNA.OKI2018_I69.chr2.g5696.t1.cds [Oikopleura dioica]
MKIGWLIFALFGQIKGEKVKCPVGCECDLTVTNCNDPTLRYLNASGIDDRTEILILDGTNFTEVPSTFLSGLQNLKELVFRANPFQALRTGAIRDMSSLEAIKFEDSKINYVDCGGFLNLPNLKEVSFEDSKYLVFLASGAFKECPEVVKLDISGTSLRYLDLNFAPEVAGSGDLRCSCYNDWVSDELCQEGEEKESCDEPVAVLERYTFDFEANSPHEARCFFVGGDSDEATITSFTGEQVGENGRFQPALVDRTLDGEYLCSLGSAQHIMQIDVFRSEDDALIDAQNDKPSKLTVATLDVDFSSDLPFFGDYFDITFVNVTDYDEKNETEGSTEGSSEGSGMDDSVSEEHVDIKTGSVGRWTGWYIFWLTLGLVALIFCLLLCHIMPRCGFYLVMFNLNRFQPRKQPV